MSTEANSAAWYAWSASQRHIERIPDPVERRQAAIRLRDHITTWIDRTAVYSAESAEDSAANLRIDEVTCRGSVALGTACGHCSRCQAEMERAHGVRDPLPSLEDLL